VIGLNVGLLAINMDVPISGLKEQEPPELEPWVRSTLLKYTINTCPTHFAKSVEIRGIVHKNRKMNSA